MKRFTRLSSPFSFSSLNKDEKIKYLSIASWNVQAIFWLTFFFSQKTDADMLKRNSLTWYIVSFSWVKTLHDFPSTHVFGDCSMSLQQIYTPKMLNFSPNIKLNKWNKFSIIFIGWSDFDLEWSWCVYTFSLRNFSSCWFRLEHT